jgi:hypothetical protein
MSTACPACGTTLERVPRSLVGRLFLRKVMSCPKCRHVERVWRTPLERETTFVLSRYSRCIQCGSYRVRRLAGRDRIDGLSTHVLSVLVGLTFAPYYHCNACRLQYHDWRAIHPSYRTEPKPANTSTQ